MSEELLKKYAEAFDIDIEQVTEKRIRQEYRYLFVIELLHKNKKYSESNYKPITDLVKARRIAYNRLKKKVKFKISDKDFITFSCMEFLYSDVPVEKVLKENSMDLQCITSRWMTNEELEELLK